MHHPHHCPHPPHTPHGTCGGHEQGYFDYDPADHKHHHHGPHYIVDKCADECDDQLPLFSQVGRGLEGEGYKVEVSYDDTDETYLTGYYHDPHTGADTLDWVSENINGGRLYYSYHIRNFTDPQTFTITFRYVRPNRDADEEGTVWSWTSPAIPYVGDEDMGDLIASWVSTLYLRKKGENWNWRKHEKLVYPEGMTHQSVNAPGPEEGWTVNLTYGIDEDCDIVVPTVEDLAKIIGMDPDEIYNLVKRGLPSDVIPDGMNVKQYIDSKTGYTYDATSLTPLHIAVNKKVQDKKTTFELSSKFKAGPGIQFKENPDGTTSIVNTQVGGIWKDLRPGVDFDWSTHNGWYFGVPPTFVASQDMKTRLDTNAFINGYPIQNPPRIRAIISRNPDGTVSSADIYLSEQNVSDLSWMDDDGVMHPENSKALYNIKNLIGSCYIDEWDTYLLNKAGIQVDDPTRNPRIVNHARDDGKWEQANMVFLHDHQIYNRPNSAIVSFEFKGDYEFLNDLNVIGASEIFQGIPMWSGRNDGGNPKSNPDMAWRNVGARWEPTAYLYNLKNSSVYVNGNAATKNIFKCVDGKKFKQFIMGFSGVSDGFSGASLRTPHYQLNGQDVQTIAAVNHVNFYYRFTLS